MIAKPLILLGVLLVVVGSWLAFGPEVPLLGKLPGDIRVERPGFRFTFPLMTCLLLSAVVSAVLHLVSRLH